MNYRNRIYQWAGDSSQPYPNDYIYRSRKWIYPYEITFTHARLLAETEDRQDYFDALKAQTDTLKRNAQRISGHALHGAIGEDAIGILEIDGDLLETVPTVPDYSGDFHLTANFYVDGNLYFTKEIYAFGVPFKIKKGYRGKIFEYELTGNVTVMQPLEIATSIDELMK